MERDIIEEWAQTIENEATRRIYLSYMAFFCKANNVEPQVLLSNSPEGNEALLQTTISEILSKRISKNVKNLNAAVNSFLRHYNVKLEVQNGRKLASGKFAKFSEEQKNYGWLLDYDVITIWIDDYQSKSTRENYLSGMNRFLREVSLNPDELLSLHSKKVRFLYRKVKQKLIKEDRSSIAKGIHKVLKSFFDAHERDIHFRRKDKVQVKEKRIIKQEIPSKEEIYRMADNSASSRIRAIILCLFHSGVRVNAIRRWKYGMVKDYFYPELKIPVRIRITNEIDTKVSSYGLGYYYTFLQDEAAESLRGYIEYRKKVYGWMPQDEDLIFVSPSSKKSVSYYTIREGIKKAAVKSGLNAESVWVHLLRKAFRKVLYSAPIDNDMAEAIMGHKVKGSKENYFDRHDLNWIASEYLKANFSREGMGRLNHLEKEKQRLEEEIVKIKDRAEIKEKEQLGRIDNLEEIVKSLAEELKGLLNEKKAD